MYFTSASADLFGFCHRYVETVGAVSTLGWRCTGRTAAAGDRASTLRREKLPATLADPVRRLSTD
jgi:hypothetical protein